MEEAQDCNNTDVDEKTKGATQVRLECHHRWRPTLLLQLQWKGLAPT